MNRHHQINSSLIYTIVYAITYTAFLLLTPEHHHRTSRKPKRHNRQHSPVSTAVPNTPSAPKPTHLRAEAPVFTPTLTDRLPIIATTNARSITNKTELLNQFLADAKIDVAIVTETWLHDNNTKIIESQFRDNFSVVSTTRVGRRGGGVSILVNKRYVANCTQLHLKLGNDDDDINLEITAARFRPYKLPRGYPDVLVIGVYLAEFEKCRQSRGIYRLKEAIENALVSGNRSSRPLILVAGDFNGAIISPLLSSLQIYQVNKHATRGERCLDLILTNAPKCYVSETWPELGASDHKTVVALPPSSRYRERLPVAETRPVRSGKLCDTVAEIRAVNWSPIVAQLNLDPQAATDEFYNIMKSAEDLHQPIKMFRTRGDKPWMTPEIKRLIQKRQRVHQQGSKQRWKQLAGLIKG
jgi:hypothetical protein